MTCLEINVVSITEVKHHIARQMSSVIFVKLVHALSENLLLLCRAASRFKAPQPARTLRRLVPKGAWNALDGFLLHRAAVVGQGGSQAAQDPPWVLYRL